MGSSAVEMKLSQKIADFIVDLDYASIPPEAVEIAENAICDCIGVAVAGADESIAEILAAQVRQMGAAGKAGVICRGFKTSTDLAAWMNGTLSHALDYDDSFSNSAGYNHHPTATLLPALLAIAETYETSGKEVLTAYICGVEIEFGFGASIGRHCSELGWHPTPILGTIGATCASAKMLKLNPSQIRAAMGIASSFAGGLMRNAGSMTKPMHAGNAVRNGLFAALLAKGGLTSNEDILEGELGFLHLFSGQRVRTLIDEGHGLGRDWKIVSPGISFKPYPCCRGTHPSIDGALSLKEKQKIKTDEVKSVICKTSPMIPRLVPYHRPKTGPEGRFSLEYCVATSLLRGKPRIEDFTDESVNDSAVQDLLSRVNYAHPPSWPTGPDLTQEVVIQLKNHVEYSCQVRFPKGEPENPMTRDELWDKFKNCVGRALSPIRSEHVRQAILSLRSSDNIAALMNTLTYGAIAEGDKSRKN
jgi:2-methylcitrate dehydratase PrpD